MVHEISQFEIPDRQLLASKTQPVSGMWSDIGEAKVTRTLFGGTKVRVIRAQDKKRRAWLLTVLALMLLAVAAWQVWIALQHSELLAALPSLDERIRVSAPIFQPEDIPAAPTSAKSRQKTLTEIVLDGMATRRPPPPQQPLKPQTVAKPFESQPPAASKLQTAKQQTEPLDSVKNPDMQPLPKLSDPMQPVAATVPPVAPSINPVAPSNNKDTSLSSAGNNQSPVPINPQPQASPQP